MKAQGIKLARDNPGDLKPIADALGLSLETTVLFGRQNEGITGIVARPEIQTAAFSGQVLVNGKNSELIKINESADLKESTLLMVHLNKHQPAHQQTLEVVETQVRERLVSDHSAKKVKTVGEALVASLKAGTEETLELGLGWATKSSVRRDNQEIDRAIIMHAFKLPAPDTEHNKPSVTGFVLPNGDYVALEVTKLKLGDMSKLDSGTKTAYQKKLTEMQNQIEYGLYVHDILSKAKVKFFDPSE